MNAKVIVGMSGGVDSSVAALLLKKEGFGVEGLFMKNWEMDDKNGYCAAAKDLSDAQMVADKLDIKLHTVNFAKEYENRVFSYFLKEYASGRTPNPDVLCNREIKFDLFFNHALNLGADFIATGHYATIREHNNELQLFKAKDLNKDQTYFLNSIDKKVFKNTLFPVGSYLKPQIRKIAEEHALPTFAKKDSTGICFIGEKKFKQFLSEFLLATPGEIITTDGEVIGQHDGLMFYTLGQREGLGLGGQKGNSNQEPFYVVEKDIPNNKLIVAVGKNHPLLFSQGLMCSEIHWLTDNIPQMPATVHAKIRYRQDPQPCVISPLLGLQGQNTHCVMFSSLQRAVTPGQYIVFYDNKRCLGGAQIESVIR